MLPTRLTRYREYRTHIEAFGGINVTDAAEEGASYAHTVPNTEISAECNMTAEYYPAIGIRGKRYEREIGSNIWLPSVEATYNDGLFFICEHGTTTHTGSYAHYRGSEISGWNLTSAEYAGEHSFVNIGAYIIIMPEGIWFNTVEYRVSGASLSDYAGKIEIEKVKANHDGVLMYPCFDDGTVASCYPTGTLPINNSNFPASGAENEFFPIYNGDKSEVNVYRWHNGSAVLNSDKIVKITSSVTGINVGRGFFVGDCVSLSDLEIRQSDTEDGVYELNFGNYATVIACDDKSLTLRLNDVDNTSYANYCLRITHAESEQAPFVGLVNFTIKRVFPKLDYICEWNNRLWGCGGDNNNTIYASALGNPCSWSLYGNTAADSYWANVDTADDWTAAFTFSDHAYFFKGEKCYKLYGTRPANFSYQKLDFGTNDNKSICTADGQMYFTKPDGIYVTSGTTAYRISDKLGYDEFHNCAGFIFDKRLYMYCGRGGNAVHLYTLDIARGLWHDESTVYISSVCSVPNDVIVVDNERAFCLGGTTGSGYAEPTGGGALAVGSWYFETQDFQVGSANAVYISRLQVNLSVDAGARCHIKVMYDGDGAWRQAKTVAPCSRTSVFVPLAPRRSRSFKLRFEGEGNIKIYGITYNIQGGSEYYGKC